MYISPCGVGLGHVTRSEALAQELSDAGCDVLFSSYLDALSYLRRTRWKHVESPPISFRTREDGTIDAKLTATQNGVTVGLWKLARQLVSEIQGIIHYDPGVVVSDTRLSTLLAGRLLRRPTVLIVNQYSVQMPSHPEEIGLLDKAMLAYARVVWKYASALLDIVWGMSKVIVIPDLDRPITISEYNLSIPKRVASRVRFVGPLSIRRPIKQSRRNAYPGKPKIFACISGPARDRQHLAKLMIDLLKPISERREIVISCGDPEGSPFPRWQDGMTIYEWMEREDYELAFREADVVLSRAGHSTIMMGIVTGKPLILIPPPNHTEQENNARRAEELGIATVLDQSSLDGDRLHSALTRALAGKREWPLVLKAAIKGQNGTETLARLVCSLAQGADAREARAIVENRLSTLLIS